MQQLLYLGNVAAREDEDPVRCSILMPGSLEPRQLEHKRRHGRPRLEWLPTVRTVAGQIAGSIDSLSSVLLSRTWPKVVKEHFSW